jgi:hypothetical protein
MNDYEILKQEESLCNDIWNSKPTQDLTHYHMCDFEILNFRYCKNRRQLEKTVEKKCKEYLASIGQERDEYMCCCDTCIHDRYLTVSEKTDGLILNIATLGLDYRTMKGKDGSDETERTY